MRRFWLSDTHFGHAKVATKRGFDSAREHDEVLIDNINSMVRRSDQVWHLGDVGVGPEAHTLQCMERLHGRWYLISGNHDKPWPGHRRGYMSQRKWLKDFQSVQPFGRTQIGEVEVLMSHFPYEGDHTIEARSTQFRLRDEGAILLHGHTHLSEKVSGAYEVNLSLEAWGLKPATEAELLEVIRSLSAYEEIVGRNK